MSSTDNVNERYEPQEDSPALMLAAKTGDILQLRREANPLASAVHDGDIARVISLLEEQADPNSTDPNGETPLFVAAAKNDHDVAAALLLYKAEPSRESSAFMVPADLATAAVVQSLIQIFEGREVSRTSQEEVLDALSDSLRLRVSPYCKGAAASGPDYISNSAVPKLRPYDEFDLTIPQTLEADEKQPSGQLEHGTVLSSTSSTSGDYYRVAHGPMVAVRQSPSAQSRVVHNLKIGDVICLGESDASGAWRLLKSVAQTDDYNAGSGWVPLHSVLKGLLEPVAADGSSVGTTRVEDISLAMQQLRPPHGQPSPEAAALLEVFQTGKPQSSEARAALGKLDPRTVRIVLAASLLAVQRGGLTVHGRRSTDAR